MNKEVSDLEKRFSRIKTRLAEQDTRLGVVELGIKELKELVKALNIQEKEEI